MEEIFIRRIEELDLNKEEREFILNNVKICSKIYARGMRDTCISLENLHMKQD